jgi:hypothetical protein
LIEHLIDLITNRKLTREERHVSNYEKCLDILNFLT